MRSYSTSNPQRPQTKEAIQEFHSRPPAYPPSCQMCRLKCVSTLHMSSLQEARSRSHFKDESKSMCVLGVGDAYLILMPVACLIWQGGWKKWKQGISPGHSHLWSWRPQKAQQRRQKPQVGGSKCSGTPGHGNSLDGTRSNEGRLKHWKCLCIGVMPTRPEDQPSVKVVVGWFEVWDTSQYLSLRSHQELGLYWMGRS